MSYIERRSYLVLVLAVEAEGILGLSVGDLVVAVPLVDLRQQAGLLTLNIVNVVKLGSKGVANVNRNDLPVGLALYNRT